MDDREMLELAAKAAGIDVFWPEYGNGEPYIKVNGTRAAFRWSPLTDDADALRLAVKLKMLVEVADTEVTVIADKVLYEPTGDDPYAATRRAIVRAAAAIGKEGK